MSERMLEGWLVGLLVAVAGVGALRAQGAEDARGEEVEAQLQRLSVALQNYHSDQGRYPRLAPRPTAAEDGAHFDDDAPALYAGLMNRPTAALGGGQNAPYADSGGLRAAILEDTAALAAGSMATRGVAIGWEEAATTEFQQAHQPLGEAPLVFLDPWGNPYHYREWASVRTSIVDGLIASPVLRRLSIPGEEAVEVEDAPHRPSQFDLWSNGPNGINEYGAPGSDDVVLWSRD